MHTLLTSHRSRFRQGLPLAALAAAAALVIAGCAGSDAGDLPIDDPLGDPAQDEALDGGDGAADGSCLAGDPDCTDESTSGGDVATPVPLSDAPSDADAIAEGPTQGATGRPIEAAHLLDETTLQLTFSGGACDTLEDVMVEVGDTEVRALVLSGQSAEVEMCTAQVVQWSTTVTLDEPFGDRTLLDLAG